MQKTTLYDTVYVASTTRPNPYRQKLDEWYLGVRGTVKVEREGLLMGASSPPLAGEAGEGRYFILFYLLIFWPRLATCGTLVPQPGMEALHPAVEALEAQSLDPWTTRGALMRFLLGILRISTMRLC